MPRRRIHPDDMTPRTRRRWRVRRAIVAVLAVVVWSVLVGFVSMFVAMAYSPVLDAIMLFLWVIGMVFLILAAAMGWMTGARAPYPGTACRACKYDLAALLPGDGVEIICPECGHANRLRPPTCGTCGYALSDVPADEHGIRRCPECGAMRRLTGAQTRA